MKYDKLRTDALYRTSQYRAVGHYINTLKFRQVYENLDVSEQTAVTLLVQAGDITALRERVKINQINTLPLDKLTVSELRRIGKNHHILNYYSLQKRDLIDAITIKINCITKPSPGIADKSEEAGNNC